MEYFSLPPVHFTANTDIDRTNNSTKYSNILLSTSNISFINFAIKYYDEIYYTIVILVQLCYLRVGISRPSRPMDLPRPVLCFLIDVRICFEMYRIVFQLILKYV